MGYRDVSILDISANGALVEAIDAKGFAVGDRGSFRVLGAEDRQILALDATVMRRGKDKRIGLELRHIGPGTERAMHELIKMNLGNEELIQRGLCVLLQPSDSAQQ